MQTIILKTLQSFMCCKTLWYSQHWYYLNGQVSGNNCLSAIRFRGGLVWQVSCYTLLTRIPTSMATVLLSTPNRTLFRFIGRLEQIRSSPAYLENVRLSPSSPVLLTRNGPLRIFDTVYKYHIWTYNTQRCKHIIYEFMYTTHYNLIR